MSITTAIAEIEAETPGLNEDMFAALKARTVAQYGIASGAEISGVILQFGLLL